MTEYHGPVLNSPADTRVRFCPSPTGTPHVGMVRTCLFNWAYARHYTSETQRRQALPAWLHLYNHHRPHTATQGHPPITRLTNLPDQYT